MGWVDILFPLIKKTMGGDSPMIDELIVQHNRIKDDLMGLAVA
jgi:hypothetical protein